MSAPPHGDRATETGTNGASAKMDSANEMKAHEKTYGGFIGLIKWTVPVVVVITIVVILLIA